MTQVNNYKNQYLNYLGPFNIEVISTLAKSLQENIVAIDYIKKKLYRVFIELTQNVALYSFERVLMSNGANVGKGSVSIDVTDDLIKVTTKNKIIKEHSSILIENCININVSSVDQLREKKKNLRETSTIKDTGAHIGLIMVSIYSGNTIDYEIIHDKNTDETYFRISATIIKKSF